MVRKERVSYEQGADGKATSALACDPLFNDDVFFELSEAACFQSIVETISPLGIICIFGLYKGQEDIKKCCFH